MAKFIAILPKNGNFSKDRTVAKRAVTNMVASDRVELEADSIEDVYAQLNHGSGQELKGYTGRSLSVGDVVIDDENTAWMCDSFGWSALDNS